MTTRISSNDPPDDVNTPQEEMDAKPTGLPTAAMRLARADRLNRQDLESAEKAAGRATWLGSRIYRLVST